MFNNKKPLFSRPVLAVIMVLSTLVIWVLNLTAPASPFPTPNIQTWKTSSGIPVIWLNQDKWKGTNKLEMRFTFQNESQNLALADATSSLLLSDSLPLSTATINQRLAPLTAKVDSYYDHEVQSIGLTLNSEPQFLAPSLELLTQWLPKPTFKASSLDRWRSQLGDSLSVETEFETTLFYNKDSRNTQMTPKAITLETIRQHYQTLLKHTSAIVLAGDMTQQTQTEINAFLNTLNGALSADTETTDSLAHDSQTSIIEKNKGSQLTETRSMIALTPLTSVKQWLSLQIWGADLVDTMGKQNAIGYVRLNLTLSAKHPWARWRIQHSAGVLVTPDQKRPNNLDARSFIDIAQIPSAHDKKRFTALFDHLKAQLEQKAIDPNWWSYLAATTAQQNSQLPIEQFAQTYQEAISSFDQDDYQKALQSLFITSSYQEIRVHQ